MARYFKFGLLVTGKGEEAFLPALLQSLTAAGNCTFKVLRKVDQRAPRTSAKRVLQVTGTSRRIPNKDEHEIGLPARRHLDSDRDAIVLLIDDLERARRSEHQAVFGRYREALDTMLGAHYTRASVHFMVNMLEAYYFADARVVRDVLGISLEDDEGDVEDIPHPKNMLKGMAHGFDEVRDGEKMVACINLAHVLRDPSTCGSLRVLVAWCRAQMGHPRGALFSLSHGALNLVTGPQLGSDRASLAVL